MKMVLRCSVAATATRSSFRTWSRQNCGQKLSPLARGLSDKKASLHVQRPQTTQHYSYLPSSRITCDHFYNGAPEIAKISRQKFHTTVIADTSHEKEQTQSKDSSKSFSVSVVGNKAKDVTIATGGMSVCLGDLTLQLPWIWLRDHCRCDTCYNHSTLQKNVDFYQLTPDISPKQLAYDGTHLVLTWPDGHVTSYSIDWLVENSPYCGNRDKTDSFLWDDEKMKSEALPTVPYTSYMDESRDGLKQSLHNLLRYGFTLITGSPATIEGTDQVLRRICHVQETLYGKVWSFTADMTHSDTAYTNLSLGAHTDNTYFCAPSGIQGFHCLEHVGDGGETLLVDGFHAAEQIRDTEPDSFEILTKTVVPHENIDKMGQGHKLHSLGTVLTVHPTTQNMFHIRFNPYDRAPLDTVPVDRIPTFYHAYHTLTEQIRNPRNEFWIKLHPGMVLLVDNWRVLHGRASFTGKRVVCGGYLPRDDWLSRARIYELL